MKKNELNQKKIDRNNFLGIIAFEYFMNENFTYSTTEIKV